MIDIEKDGLTQKIISDLAQVSASSVSNYLAMNNISAVPRGNVRNIRYPINISRQCIKDLSKKKHSSKKNKNISESNFPIKLKKHCFFNFKGGTGKTSICYQISSYISLMGYKVLVMDLDPQGHLSTAFGINVEKNPYTMYDKIAKDIAFKNLIHVIYEDFDCISSNLSLAKIEQYLGTAHNRENQLSNVMREIENDYDFIFIDMNPSVGFLNWNVINYCDVINIVTETQPFSINSIKLLFEELTNFYRVMNIPERLIHIIPNKYEAKTTSSAESMSLLNKYYSQYSIANFAISKSEEINSSAKFGKPLPFFAKKNSGAYQDILDLAKYIKQLSL